ncbi:MAG: single-stranded DNA-binding protein [SAR202 cluster bacterium]|nr:single-stranded DNA-binding protein [SAR202 cluster bacterium]
MGRLNKIMLIGYAGQDAEQRFTPNGDSVSSFSLAVSRRYTNREGQQIDETEWFRINVWGNRADFVGKYIKKGMNVYAEGRLSHSIYQDNAGETKVSLDVNAFEIQIVQDPDPERQYNPMQQPQSNPPQQQSNPSQQQQPNPVQQPSTEPSTEDDPDKLPW